ncbi:MAG: membrane protein insertase YidC [Treponema sp.]|nr:membrane protein insertase YidC [Treponema sp.]MCL2273058.1 membrane protein insertase YidC [Treponema sp.]
MEKNTVLAVVLSTVVLIVFFFIQSFTISRQQAAHVVQQQESHVTAIDTEPVIPSVTTPVVQAPEESIVVSEPQPVVQQPAAEQQAIIPTEYITIDTELYTAVLSNAGGDMVSFRWKDARNDSQVDLILSGSSEARAFSIAFGDASTPVVSNFHINRISEYSIEFYRDFSAASGIYGVDGSFRLTKRYDFIPGEYLFRLTVTMDGGFSLSSLNFGGNAYTLSFGPQIGPVFEKLDNFYDYRQYSTFTNGKRKNAKVNDNIDNRSAWAAISGKYFVFIARPLLAQYSLAFSESPEPGLVSASRLNIIRPAANVSKIEDIYQFYLGPKTQETLAIYNTGRNEFGIKDANLDEAASSRGFWSVLAPLEKLLKWLLLAFYSVVHNYGIAIILLTLLIKALFFPLTKKGSEATIRMQALGPKIKELQEKYKNNPQKLQAEMGNFYRQEGYNPLSGCLPMLLQLPIFIAMYQLFNNHFDLRGAGFIPGWIPDLSVPEYIVQFNTFRVPIFGWTALRALPFIYVGSQLLYGKFTQMPGQQSNAQMKMMLYVMPIVFFFILYDVPSGLLIYWIFSNVLTLVQQIIINKYIVKKKQSQPPPAPEVVQKKKRKK